jgi:hypothetical protein
MSAKPKAKSAEIIPMPDLGRYAGITATKCPDACMQDGICIISTVNVCKHPVMNGDGGCGPITTKNRGEAMKVIKHQQVDTAT